MYTGGIGSDLYLFFLVKTDRDLGVTLIAEFS